MLILESTGFVIFLIILLIGLNGFFAAAEIAVVSSRRSRIEQLAKGGRRSAEIVGRWLKEPEVFLATVQIGVTFVGALASAVGGASALRFLTPQVARIDILAPWAESISIGLVVVAISYLSLVLGELVPKSLALTYRESLATLVARPIHALSLIARPLVYLLTQSTRLVLRLLGKKEIPKELFVSEEEIRFLIKEGGAQGIFDQTEQQLIPRIFEFADIRIRDLMIPRERMSVLDIQTPREELLDRVAEEAYTRLPVFKGDLDHVIGVLHMKDLIYMVSLGQVVILHDLLRPPVFIGPEAHAKDLLRLFQKQHVHMAIVQENGKTVGLVTLEDLIERIVGDIRDEHDVI